MITGKITIHQEAVIELEVVGLNQPARIETVIDTGFTGYLTLPSTLIDRLKLQQAGDQITILGDENRVVLKIKETCCESAMARCRTQRVCSTSRRRPIDWNVFALWKSPDIRCRNGW